MKTTQLILRILVGALMVLFGANKLFLFLPAPEPHGLAGEITKAFLTIYYLMPMVGLFELIIGLLFLSNKWMPLATLMLVPISINILAFHAFADLQSIAAAAFVALINVYFIYVYQDKYWPLLKIK